MEIALNRSQKFLGKNGLVFLVFLINMTAPMSTDMYLPAFPTLINEFHTTASMLSYTLVGFFISFALGMLFIGPLSDKLGRKPILIGGVLVYGLFSLCCSFAQNIEQLILFRILQAIGGGGMVAVSMAIVKDAFSDDERPQIIALLQMLGAFAPTVAPIIGAQIIEHFSWRETFDVLALISLLTLTLSILLEETLPKNQRLNANVFQTIYSLKDVLVKKPFMIFLFSMTGPTFIYLGFLALSSYIYIDWFGLSKTTYSIFFAINSLVLIVGPRTYIFFHKKLNAKQIIRYSFVLIFLSAVLLLTVGHTSPYVFLICFFPITFSNGFLRSFATNVLLGQENMNAGGAASIINFMNTAMGALGMVIATLGWNNVVQGIGAVALIGVLFSIILWRIFLVQKMSLKGIE